MIRNERWTEKVDIYSFGIVMSELDTRKIPYHDLRRKTKKKIVGAALMHDVAYANLRPSLSDDCLPAIRSLYERCVASNPKLRPSFTDIIEILEGPVKQQVYCVDYEKKHQLSGANLQPEQDDEYGHAHHHDNNISPTHDNQVQEYEISAEELGVTHATKYIDL